MNDFLRVLRRQLHQEQLDRIYRLGLFVAIGLILTALMNGVSV